MLILTPHTAISPASLVAPVVTCCDLLVLGWCKASRDPKTPASEHQRSTSRDVASSRSDQGICGTTWFRILVFNFDTKDESE